MTYSKTVKLNRKEVERIERLLSIISFEELTDEEMNELGAKCDDFIPLFWVDFEDGPMLTVDVCSGSNNYYINAVWSKGWKEVVLDCQDDLSLFDVDFDDIYYLVTVEVEDVM